MKMNMKRVSSAVDEKEERASLPLQQPPRLLNEHVATTATTATTTATTNVPPTTTSESTTTTTTPPPQVLTRSMISNNLVAMTALDAGDVIECYLLTRKSFLHGTLIQITKHALGLRYRHRPATGRKYDDSGGDSSSGSSTTNSNNHGSQQRRRLELTMEYGPARAGPNLAHESIPDPNTPQDLTWDNEGTVYVTESIDSDSFTSANYLASLSGTLVSQLLHSALDFTQGTSTSTSTSTATASVSTTHRRRRYQPFSVYLASSLQPPPPPPKPQTSTLDNNSDTTTTPIVEPVQILRSNSDSDFLYYLFTRLTDLGVELKPVILPVVTELRLHAVEMTKIRVGSHHYPTEFYQKLWSCVKAIGSTDYTAYNISKAMTTTTTTTTTDVAIPTVSPTTLVPLEPPVYSSEIVRPPTYAVQSPTFSGGLPTRPIRRVLQQNDDATTTGSTTTAGPTAHVVKAETALSTAPSTTPVTAIPTAYDNSTLLPTPLPTQNMDNNNPGGNLDMATHQEEAATAAQHAQEAADAAGAADTEDEAVSAAQQAAVYAQKAATVTANQAALIAREAMVSGVGPLVAQAVSLCFSDPLYGIANKNVNATTEAASSSSAEVTAAAATVYLYWDGTFYYRMNLTAPYVTVSSYARPMPKPPAPQLGPEDFVDWSIVFILAILSAIGFVLLLQHVMGRNLKVIRPLYRCQLWFFQPTKFDWDEMMVESEAARGIPEEYSLGDDAIPLSMGGQKVGNKVATAFKSGSSHSIHHRVDEWFGSNSCDEDDEIFLDDNNDTSALIEMEMVSRSQPQFTSPIPNNSSSHSAIFRKGTSFHSEKSFDDDVAVTDSTAVESNSIGRFLRDPNLVDLPDLTSSSRVAIPVSTEKKR